MGCILTKLECCVVAGCCHCIYLQLGCILIAVVAILFWTGTCSFLLVDDGIGFFNQTHGRWLARAYMMTMLSEATIRIVMSIVLIIGAAKKKPILLTTFLITWVILVLFILCDVPFAIVVSHLDAVTILFHTIYAGIRFSFTVVALIIVNSYRLELMDEAEAFKKQINPAVSRTAHELVL